MLNIFQNKADEIDMECDIRKIDKLIWYRNVKERDHLKDTRVDGRVILKWIFKSRMEMYRQNSSSTSGRISWT